MTRNATPVRVTDRQYALRVIVEVPPWLSDYVMDSPRNYMLDTHLDVLLYRLVETSRGRLICAEDETLGFHGDDQLCITLWGERPVTEIDVKRLVKALGNIRQPKETDGKA